MSVKKAIIALILCMLCGYRTGHHSALFAQSDNSNLLIRGSVPSALGRYPIPIAEISSSGVCAQYAFACASLVDDFTFFNRNAAASSLVYSGPFIGFAHYDAIAESSLESFAFAHTINRFGFGFALHYLYTIIDTYNNSAEVVNIFSPSDLLFGVNFSHNFLRTTIVDGISLGVNVKGALSILPAQGGLQQSNGTLLADIGFLVNLHALKIIDFPDANLGIGISHRNIGALFEENTEFLPGTLIFGLSYAPLQYLQISSDVELPFRALATPNFGDAVAFSVGLGIFPIDILEIGGGFHFDAGRYLASAGISLQILGTQIRFVQHFDPFTDFNRWENFSISVSLKTQNTIAPDRRLSVQRLYLQGLQAFLAEDLEGALTLVNSALVISPRYQPALTLRRQIIALQRVQELLN